MRALDPFGFFFDHASAIAGYGGKTPSPDPRYCFHTHYEDVRPGPALFRVVLKDARSRMGELTVRVHAYRASGVMDAMLVAGSLLQLENRQGGDLVLEVRFRAVRDAQYALYGFFSEGSDLLVADIEVALEEIEEGDDRLFAEDVARSILADRAVGASASQSSALVLAHSPTLQSPVSQDCTLRQLRSHEFVAQAGKEAVGVDALHLWSEVVCRQALDVYGAALFGMRGLLIGGASPLLSAFCEERGMPLQRTEWNPVKEPEPHPEHGHVDFLVSWLDVATLDGARARYETIVAVLSRLLVGGLGLVCLRYDAEANTAENKLSGAAENVTRNEIGQWLLRLIGAGFSAAPVAFSPVAELAKDEAGRTAIVLVLRRL